MFGKQTIARLKAKVSQLRFEMTSAIAPSAIAFETRFEMTPDSYRSTESALDVIFRALVARSGEDVLRISHFNEFTL